MPDAGRLRVHMPIAGHVVSMPSKGRHMLMVEARDAEYGELLGMLRISATSY